MIAIFALSCRIVVGVRTPNSRARDVTLERGKCKFQAIFFFSTFSLQTYSSSLSCTSCFSWLLKFWNLNVVQLLRYFLVINQCFWSKYGIGSIFNSNVENSTTQGLKIIKKCLLWIFRPIFDKSKIHTSLHWQFFRTSFPS